MNLFNEILDFTNYKPLGLNYYGAKKLIAPQIFQLMHERHFKRHGKKAEYFLDCFGGGGSMSLAALQLGYKAIYNELRPDLCTFFRGVKDGKSVKLAQEISREEFKAIGKIPKECRTFDEVAKMLFFSFNFSGVDNRGFAYGKHYHLSVPFFDAMKGLNFANFEVKNGDYFDFLALEIEPSEIMIYADIPYQDKRSKKNYRGIYDSRFYLSEFLEFCDGLQGQGYEVYVSEYNAPSEDFECILKIPKIVNSVGRWGAKAVKKEKIFVLKDSENERQAI